jgi:hypothetical protein
MWFKFGFKVADVRAGSHLVTCRLYIDLPPSQSMFTAAIAISSAKPRWSFTSTGSINERHWKHVSQNSPGGVVFKLVRVSPPVLSSHLGTCLQAKVRKFAASLYDEYSPGLNTQRNSHSRLPPISVNPDPTLICSFPSNPGTITVRSMSESRTV